MGELADLGLSELLDDGGVTLVEWGDAVVSAVPADHLEVRITFGDGDDDRDLELRAGGPALGGALAGGGRGRGGLAMLILGIESATEQVGCAIGGHEGVLGPLRVWPGAGATPRR